MKALSQNWRMSHHWQRDAARKAQKLFPNQGLHSSAAFIASLHPNAIDYLGQAPVLACALHFKGSSKADKLYIASRIGGPLERGEPLKKVMKAVHLSYPLRQLEPYALSGGKAELLRELSKLNPSTLSQAIPVSASAQRIWLTGLSAFVLRWSYGAETPLPMDWAVRAIAQALPKRHEAEDIADYLRANTTPDLKRWSWSRAEMEKDIWHDRLRLDRELPHGIKSDTIIDLSDWPDVAEIDGFELYKLKTPSMITAEGRAMRHCVASYMCNVVNGDCTLFSIRKDMKRVATAEFRNGSCVQLRGFANKLPSKELKAVTMKFSQTRWGKPS